MEETSLEEVTDAEMIDAFLDARQTDLHVAMPCKVESYDRSAGTVDVVPALNRSLPDGDGNYVSRARPKLTGVPVQWPRTTQFALTFPLRAGDYGLLVVCERNIAAWRATGNQGDPGDLGMHTLDGAVFLPGLYPDSSSAQSADASNMVIGSDTNGSARIIIKPTAEVDVGAAAANFVAMSEKVKAWLDAFNAAVTGWTPVAMDGGAALKAALATLIAGTPTTDVASTNLKAEG
jgi:hypothetical protein